MKQRPVLAVYLEDGRIRDVLDPLDHCNPHGDNDRCGGCANCLVMQCEPDYWWRVPAEWYLRGMRVCRWRAGENYATAFAEINNGAPEKADVWLRSMRSHLLRALVLLMLWSKELPTQIEADAELDPEHLVQLRAAFERCAWARGGILVYASLDKIR